MALCLLDKYFLKSLQQLSCRVLNHFPSLLSPDLIHLSLLSCFSVVCARHYAILESEAGGSQVQFQMVLQREFKPSWWHLARRCLRIKSEDRAKDRSQWWSPWLVCTRFWVQFSVPAKGKKNQMLRSWENEASGLHRKMMKEAGESSSFPIFPYSAWVFAVIAKLNVMLQGELMLRLATAISSSFGLLVSGCGSARCVTQYGVTCPPLSIPPLLLM